MSSTSLVAITVIGADRPGIVARVTKILFERGCNLEDVSSTILRGHFSMMLVVTAPTDVDAATLETDLNAAGEDLGLIVTVRPVSAAAGEVAEPTHMVSVYGADRPGIVFKVAEALATQKANITDLTSRVIGNSDSPVYALMLEVAFPEQGEPALDLGDLDVEISIHPVHADVL